jgi:hypothetical protein
MKRIFYSRPPHAHDFAVVKDGINIVIPQRKAGESIDPEKSTEAGPDTANDSLEESEDKESESDSLTGPTPMISTRSEQMISKWTSLIKEAGAAMPDLESNLEEYEIKLTSVGEQHCYEAMQILQEGEFIPEEVNCVGAGIGGGLANTKELHVMKYK